MRTIFFAQSDDAVRLAASLGCGLLIGGMSAATVEAQIGAFRADPDAILVATAAFDHGWRADVEAHAFFLMGFPGAILSAINRVTEPAVLPPTVAQLKAHACGDMTLSPASLLTLIQGGEAQAAEPDEQLVLEYLPKRSAHAALQQEDEYYCTKCGKRWGKGEEPPPCNEGDR